MRLDSGRRIFAHIRKCAIRFLVRHDRAAATAVPDGLLLGEAPCLATGIAFARCHLDGFVLLAFGALVGPNSRGY